MRYLYSIIGLLFITSVALGQSGREFRRSNVMNGNRIHTVFGNWGVIGQPMHEGQRGAWKYDTNGYIGDFSIMIGTEVVKGDTIFHSVVVCPVQRPTSQPEVSPLGKPWGFEPLAGYFSETQFGVAMSDDPFSWPSSWVEWPFDTEGALETYFVMDDNNDDEFNYADNNPWGVNFKPDSTDLTRNGLGLKVEGRYRQFDFAGLEDVLFMEYTVANEGTTPYKQVVFSGLNGTYVGCTATENYNEYSDDVCFFDIANNATFFWDYDMDVTRNPYWTGDVGYAAIILVQSPGNPYDGIDNDRDNATLPGSTAPFFTESDFEEHTIQTGEHIILIHTDYERSLIAVPEQAFEATTCGETLTIVPGETVVQEGNSGNPNAYDGIDNDFDGLIDENYDLHYDFDTFHLDEPFEIENTLGPTQYIDYRTGQGESDPLIDETGNNIDEIGLSSFDCFAPSGEIPMGDDEELWGRMTPGLFSLPSSYSDGRFITGEDADYILGSGYAPLYPDEQEKVILALVFADTPEELQTKVQLLNMIECDIEADPNLTLTAPTLGEYSGSSIDIVWQSDEVEGRVVIEGTRDNGRTWWLVEDVDASLGSYSWDISDVPDGILNRIRLRHAYKPWETSSSELFIINNPGQCAPQVIFTDSPEFGDTIGGSLAISWIAGDADGDDVTVTLSYSTTNDITDTLWYQLATFSESGSFSVDTRQLPNSQHALLKLDVSNISGMDSDMSDLFVILNSFDPLPGDMSSHVAGDGSGIFEVYIVDPSALTGHQYEVTFNGDSEPKYFDVQDLTTGEYVLTGCSQLDCSAESPMFDGVRLLICDDDAELDTAWWSDPTKAYDIEFKPLDTAFPPPYNRLIGVPHPSDYEIQFYDEIADTSINEVGDMPPQWFPPVIPVNFKIYNVSDERYIDFVFVEVYGDQTLSPNEEIVFVEPVFGDSLVFTWDITFTSEKDTVYYYGLGDALFIETLKPFDSEDVFVFETPPNTGIEEEIGSTAQVESFMLLQNYPNPFNPSTDIRYQIPDGRYPVHTILKIYNILGQEVKTLVDEARETGYYTVTWDGKDKLGQNVSSGVYFYRLMVRDFTATRKMILLK